MVFAALTAVLFAAMLIAGIALAVVFGVKRYSLNDNYDESSYDFRAKDEQEKNLYRQEYSLKLKNFKLIQGIFIGLAIIGAVLVLFIPGSFHQVNAGEIAVVKNLGKIEGTRSPGTYFDFWMTKQYQQYDAKVQTLDIVDSAYSKDAQTMDISMTVQWQIDTTKVTEIAANYGGLDALSNRIKSVAIEKTKGVLSSHKAMNDSNDPNSADGIIENREAVGVEVTNAVKNAINENYYVIINTVVLTNIDFSDVFEKTVEDKMVAEQEKLKAQYEKEKAIIEAEKELEVAKLAAEARIAAAQGDAEAQKIAADAAAYEASIKIIELARTLGYEVNEVTATEIDEDGNEVKVVTGHTVKWGEDGYEAVLKYIQYLEYLGKWNGKLPDVVGGDNLEILIPSQT